MSSLPAAPEIERSVLGAILVNNELWPSVAEKLRAEHFYIDGNRRIYAAMASLADEGVAIEQVMLANVLASRKELESVGGMASLMDLTTGVPRRQNIDSQLKVVRERAALREIINSSNQVISQALEPDASTEKILGSLESATLSIRAEASHEQRVVRAAAVCGSYMDGIDAQRRSGERQCIGLSTGIEALDFMTTGIRPQQMWCVAGRTGEGKSCIATQTISATCASGKGVYLATPEMTREQTLERLVIQNSGVPSWKFTRKYKLNDQDRGRIAATVKMIGEWNLHIDDSSCITAEEIAARARLLQKRDAVELAIVDYVQLVDGRGHDLKAQVTHVSKRLRALAKDVMPTIVLSQMPRPSDKRDLNRWPTKYDLKESGSLENDAAVIVMIYRTVNEKHLPIGEDFLIVPKQRNGVTGFDSVLLNPDNLKFVARAANP